MNKVSNHLNKLKNYSPVNISNENKLYFLEVEEKPGLIKIGDTHRDVDKRNKETMTNASLHRKDGTFPTYVLAKNKAGKSYRDKDFHKFLKNKGFEFEQNDQKNDSEWVKGCFDLIWKELEEFIGKQAFKELQLRNAQNYILDELDKALKDGYMWINLGSCVRSGKTIISLVFAMLNNLFPVYIGKNLTSQASAETDNDEFGIVPNMSTISLHGIDELDKNGMSNKVRNSIDKINRENVDNKKIIFYIDEVDDGSHTVKSRSILKPIVDNFDNESMLEAVVTMSGTRIHRGEKVLRSLTDDKIKEISLEYYEMQILQPEETVNRNYRHINFYSDGTELSNISDSMRNKDKGHKSLGTFIKSLLERNNFDININEDFPHWFIKFSTVGKSNCNAFVKYLNSDESPVDTNKYIFKTINGDFTSSKESQKYCKAFIDKHSGKICVFITQGMATTSFSIESIGNSAVFTDNEITSDDIQALHRSATWKEGKDECNLIVVTTNDSKEHYFDDIFEEEVKIASNRSEKETIYKELLNNNSMIHFIVNGKGIKPVIINKENISNVLDKKSKSMTRVASFVRVMGELDEEIQDEILSSILPKGTTSKKSVTGKGERFYPFGKEDKKNKKKNSTITMKKKEKIYRAFIENALHVPSLSREQGINIDKFDFWGEIGITKKLFTKVYKNSQAFKDRIDTVYNLCEDEDYLITNYLNKLV
jgi:hypothetical protein